MIFVSLNSNTTGDTSESGIKKTLLYRFYLHLYLYVVESLLGYETTRERAQLVAYGATTCS
jgi:hypothetical protein